MKNVQELNQVSDFVKREYDSLAQNGASTLCCSPSDTYTPEELAGIPRIVLELSSSCGSPTKGLELYPDQTILDLGCGAGLDVMLLARKLGPESHIIGVDASNNMINVAKSAALEAGIPNAEFRLGDARDIPAQDHSVDVVISNCVVGMFPDKEKVFSEVYRILKPGGYMVAIDTIFSKKNSESFDELTSQDWAACIVMMSEEEYTMKLLSTGFEHVDFRDQLIVPYRDGNEITSAKIFAFKSK
ncbi:methyltransferase domain-containing protein [Niallia sp. Krafla_26]|uniref:methyltransferase domain-containing protein n=1 Tax=Niallia sp. Krafla_26 TaxID=3064703 RepID=UPI003D173F55